MSQDGKSKPVATPVRRVGARRVSEVPAAILRQLEAGTLEAVTLAETLAIDHGRLLAAAFPELPPGTARALRREEAGGVTRRMARAGVLIHEHLGAAGFRAAAGHPSDTVRGWAAYALAARPGLSLARRLELVRPLADDAHSGVREWAWLALRPEVVDRIEEALELLRPWVKEESPRLRRFAVELTRPRGVWCAHVQSLKDDPAPGLVLLEPLRADPAKYVQDSVSNWLNDAAKHRPDWVRGLCARWGRESRSPATDRIRRRALRSL